MRMTGGQQHPRVQKWLRWLEIIRDEIWRVAEHKYIYEEVGRLIARNQKLHRPSAFYGFLSSTYASSMFMAVRRQLKKGKNGISLAQLLAQVAQEPRLLSRARFVGLYPDATRGCADRDFDVYAGEGGSHVDVKMVKEDISALRRKGLKIERWADKTVAHRDRKEPSSIPTFSELHDCVDYLAKLFQKYYALFTATHVMLEPTLLDNWMAIFTVRWLSRTADHHRRGSM